MNRYIFIGGPHEGMVCYWSRIGEYGIHVDFIDGGGPGYIPFKEWEDHSRFLDRV